MDIDYIARLARINLNDRERVVYSQQMERIIEYINKLNELDTSNVPPTSHVLPIKNVLREDTPRPSMPREEALKNAPDVSDGFYRVPRIINCLIIVLTL